MIRELTGEEIELLSIYRDREGTREQTVQVEQLLADSPEARQWLLQIERAERLAARSAAGGAGRPVDLSSITGERIAAVAGTDRHLFDLRPTGLLLCGLLGGVLVAASLLLSDPTPPRAPLIASTDGGARIAGLPLSAADEVIREIAAHSPDVSATPVLPTGKNQATTQAFSAKESFSLSDKVSDSHPDGATQEQGSPEPLHLSINLHHSSAKIIIEDDQWSDTLRFDSSEDQILSLSARLSELTDSLNAEVARIATDTTRSAQDRAGEILIRQMEYEARIAQEFEVLRRLIEGDRGFEGACLEDRGSTGVS